MTLTYRTIAWIGLFTTAAMFGAPMTQIEASSQVERNCWDPTRWEDAPHEEVPGKGDTEPAPIACMGKQETPAFASHDLTENRGYTLPDGTLQVVTFYDGEATSAPVLRIEYAHPAHGRGWIEVTGIKASTSNAGQICTYQYQLGAARVTGYFEIDGVVPNGVIDGLAFGLFWRDADGFHLLRSTSPTPKSFSALVGAWPISLNDRSFETRTPQLTTGGARQQAKMAIYGAEYLDNGRYLMTIRERAVAIDHHAEAK